MLSDNESAIVAITSSASYPSFFNRLIPLFSINLLISGICKLSSSGIFFLLALYKSYISCLKVGFLVSIAIAIYSGDSSLKILEIELRKP